MKTQKGENAKGKRALQLREDWVLEKDLDSRKILSQFKCDPSKSFEVMRRREKVAPAIFRPKTEILWPWV